MNAWIEFFGLWLADFYLAATILLTIAAILFTVIRQPAPRMAVGWGSLLGLLIAAGLCVSPSRPRFDLRPFFTRPATPVAETELVTRPIASPPAVDTTAPRPDEADEISFDRFEPPTEPVKQSARTDLPTIEPVFKPAAVAWGPRVAALAVWSFLAGMVAIASWLAVGVVRASRLVHRSAPAPVGCSDELRKIAGPSARLPRLRMNRRLVMPVATGTLRPAILLPEGFAETGSRSALKAVLAHEWTHIKNGDLWMLAVDRLVLSLLWAHPLYWWTRRRIRTNQELLADAAAASQIGPTDYAALLVEWARNFAAHRGLTALTAVGIWERPAALEQRVRALLTHSDGSLVRTAGRTQLGIAAAMATLSLFAGTLSLRTPQRVLADAPPQPVASAKSASDESFPNVPKAIQATESRPISSGVSGACRDQEGQPLAGVTVSLYAIQTATGRRQLREATTDRAGQFSLPDCLGPKTVQLSWGICDADGSVFELFAHKAGLATDVKTVTERDEHLDFTLTKAASLTGTVRDLEGKPIADAWLRAGISLSPRNGWLSARSDRQGRFAITDLAGNEFAVRSDTSWPSDGILTVEHPAYGASLVSFKRIPGEVNVVLKRAAAIEGTVVYGNSGKPAAGVSVTANWIDEPYPYMSCRMPVSTTDKLGHYRLFPLPDGQFNVCTSLGPVDKVFSDSTPTQLVATSVDSFQSRAGQSSTAPPIRLIKGGRVKGRLVQYRPGVNGVTDPVHLDPGVRLMLIAFRGPALPGPGAVTDAEYVKEDGTFEMRLPPGLHHLQLPNSPRSDGTYRLPFADMGEPSTEEDAARPLNGLHKVKIREGETTEIEISVWRPPTSLPKPKQSQAKGAEPASVVAVPPAIVDYHVNKDEIGGLCLGRGETRISGVEVSLYLESFLPRGARKHEMLGRTTTNEQGQFLFTHVRPRGPGETGRSQRYVIVARRKGLASEVSDLNHSHDWLDLRMPDAVPVRGTVKDEQGKPVVGALVRCNGNAWRSLSEGVHSARTDAQGQFQIDDVATLWGCIVEHPDFPAKVLYGESTFKPWEGNHFTSDVIKLPFEVTLAKGSIVEGQVIDSVTGQSRNGLSVAIRAIEQPFIGHRIFFAEDPNLYYAKTQTDNSGHYRFTRLPAGHFYVYLTSDVPDRASIALDSLEVPAATTVHASDLRLVKGGVVRGRLIGEQGGQPMTLGEDERVTIAASGPARPQHQSQAYSESQSFPVQRDGTFELRLPPGKNTLQVSGRPYFAEEPADRNAVYDIREIEIKDGAETTIEFRGVRLIPKKEKTTAVTPNSPSSADANSAKPEWFRVRAADLGGTWYDAAGHTIAGAKVTLVSTNAVGSARKELKATTTNSWGQFLIVCAPCLTGPNQHYELVLSRKGEAPEIRKSVHCGEWLELKAVRQVPTKRASEKATEKLPVPPSAALHRSVPTAMAEAPIAADPNNSHGDDVTQSRSTKRTAAPAANKRSTAFPSLEEEIRYATLLMNLDQTELQKALEANRQNSKTIPQPEIERLRLTAERSRLRRELLGVERELNKIGRQHAPQNKERSENFRPSDKEVLSYLPTNVAKWLASRSPTARDRMRVTVEPAIDRAGECRFYPLVGKARLQQCVFKCSFALDKLPHADAPLDIQETLKAPLVFYMQQNRLICCDDSVAQR
jgi:beta-lactamase regulating signal transducer with metallopeptidase domain